MDLELLGWEWVGLLFCIKEVIDLVLCWICIHIIVLVGDVEEIDFEDWSEEEEVSLGGGRYVGVGKLFGLVFFESRRISFAIPDGIVIYGYVVEENSCDSFWVVECIELEGDCKLVVVKALSSLDKLGMNIF